MFKTGVAKRDYQSLLTYSSSAPTRSGDSDEWYPAAEVILESVWGSPFSSGITGIRCTINPHFDSGIETTSYTVIAPFGTYAITFDGLWDTSNYFLVEYTGAQLSTTNCDAWTFTADLVEIYLGASLVLSSGGAVSYSGSGYDARYNCAAILSAQGAPPQIATPPRLPGCSGSYEEQLAFERLVTASFISPSGWRWRTTAGPGAWTEEDINLDTSLAPSAPTCPGSSCSTSFATMDASPAKCYRLSGEFSYYHLLEKASDGSTACDGESGTNNFERWHVDEDEYYKDTQGVSAHPDTGGILDTLRETFASCTDGVTTDSTSSSAGTTEAETWARFRRYVWRKTAYQECYSYDGVGLARSPGDPLPCFEPDTDLCLYVASAQLSHPNRPNCSGITGVASDISRSDRPIRAYISSAVIFEIGDASSPILWSSVDTGLTASSIALRWRPNDASQTIDLWLTTGGSLKEYTSVDEGGAWSLSRTVATGSCTQVCAVRINANTTGIYWVDGAALKGQLVDQGNNIIEATFTVVASGVDEAGISGFMRTLTASQTQIVLEYVASGSIIEKYSTDGKTFA